MVSTHVRVLVLGGCAIVWSGLASAQTAAPPTLRVSDQATVTVRPDEARIDLGVETTAESAERAARQNAQRAREVVDTLESRLGQSATVETISYAVAPQYRDPRNGDDAAIDGYRASNIVRVTLRELTRVGEAVDVALRAGANRVQHVVFTLQDEATARAGALRAAAEKARRRAEVLAEALDVRIVRLLSATADEPQPPRPMAVAMMRAEGTSSTPIEAGTIDVHASVTVTVEVAAASSRR